MGRWAVEQDDRAVCYHWTAWGARRCRARRQLGRAVHQGGGA